jgi:hypothetical protein
MSVYRTLPTVVVNVARQGPLDAIPGSAGRGLRIFPGESRFTLEALIVAAQLGSTSSKRRF